MVSGSAGLDEDALAWAIAAAINKWKRHGPRTLSEHVAAEIWPVVAEFGDRRAQEGREEAAQRIEMWVSASPEMSRQSHKAYEWAASLARSGVGDSQTADETGEQK